MEKWDNLIFAPGTPSLLGATAQGDGINFALYSSTATEVILGFFSEKSLYPVNEITLDPSKNKTDTIWHIHVKNLPPNALYAYQIDHHWVIDPYAKELNASKIWGKKTYEPILGKVFPETAFDWGKDAPLQIPFQELCIYEMHVRGFTEDKSAQVKNPGTFLGFIEKIPYLKELGINAVELLPIFEFDETANIHRNPKTGKRLFNFWGYSTINFFSPMARYGTITEFKAMVKALHEAGIEVILDVVYNHTGRSTWAWIDKKTYFIVDEKGEHTNFTGCGNTVNCNHPVVIDLILASLRYWVTEMHVDGFRFDLASIFCRGETGEVLQDPPILEAINKDPVLAKTKLIAEAWDAVGLYQVGSFPGGPRFADWNGKFRDIVRSFIKGTLGDVTHFASVMMGSQFLYDNGRAPFNSINFITAHDGFTLHDMVSYNDKHNEDNGEENRDGNNWNATWNCGVEGPTDDPNIQQLRKKQMRNFLLALFTSIGTPMLWMGDEYGHTAGGNNNPYCQDNEMNYFLWDILEKDRSLFQFSQFLIKLRKNSHFFHRTTFISEEDVTWHGLKPEEPDWGHDSRFIAYSLHHAEEDLYIAFNAHFEHAQITLPKAPNGKKWKRIVDTSLPNDPPKDAEGSYSLAPYCALVLSSTA